MKLELEQPHFSNPFFEELSERIGDLRGVLTIELNDKIKQEYWKSHGLPVHPYTDWNFGERPNSIVIYPVTFQSFLLFQGFDLRENRYVSVTDGEWLYSKGLTFEKVSYTGKGLFYEIPDHCKLRYPRKSRVSESSLEELYRLLRET